MDDEILINLNSENAFRLNGSYLSNVVFNTPSLLKREDEIVYSKITVLNCQIPVSFYIINYSNNILSYTVASVPYSITITVGNYTGNNLITELQTKFNANGHSMTITLNSLNGILTFSNSSFNFTFLVSSSCYSVLGFVDDLTSSSFSLTLTYPLNLLGQKKIKIVSKNLATKNYDSGVGSVLASIPITNSSFGLILWENTTGFSNILQPNVINTIDISLLDENNNYLNFNNQNWLITLRLSNVRK
jgi:hypothetical protein